MNLEDLGNDDMFDIYAYVPGKEEMSTEDLMSAFLTEHNNLILRIERRIDEDVWDRLDKEIAITGFCVRRKWNSRVKAGIVLKRDPETPLFCPRCDKGILIVTSRFPRIIEGGMRSDCRYIENRFILIECPSCKRVYAAFLGGEPPIHHPPHPFRRDLARH